MIGHRLARQRLGRLVPVVDRRRALRLRLEEEIDRRDVRGLEVHYCEHVQNYRAAGMNAEAAHRSALDEIREFGLHALEELEHRGLFPWAETGAVGVSTLCDATPTGSVS